MWKVVLGLLGIGTGGGFSWYQYSAKDASKQLPNWQDQPHPFLNREVTENGVTYTQDKKYLMAPVLDKEGKPTLENGKVVVNLMLSSGFDRDERIDINAKPINKSLPGLVTISSNMTPKEFTVATNQRQLEVNEAKQAYDAKNPWQKMAAATNLNPPESPPKPAGESAKEVMKEAAPWLVGLLGVMTMAIGQNWVAGVLGALMIGGAIFNKNIAAGIENMQKSDTTPAGGTKPVENQTDQATTVNKDAPNSAQQPNPEQTTPGKDEGKGTEKPAEATSEPSSRDALPKNAPNNKPGAPVTKAAAKGR